MKKQIREQIVDAFVDLTELSFSEYAKFMLYDDSRDDYESPDCKAKDMFQVLLDDHEACRVDLPESLRKCCILMCKFEKIIDSMGTEA